MRGQKTGVSPAQAASPSKGAARAARGAAIKKTAKTAGKVGKVAGNIVLPAAGLLHKEIKSGGSGTKRVAALTHAAMAKQPGAWKALGAALPKAAYAASTAIIPVVGAAVALSTARDAYKKGKGTLKAAEDGAFSGADFVLGGGLSTYNERREKGDGKIEAGIRGTLAGLDRRVLFGAGQYMVDKYRAMNAGLDKSLANARNSYGDVSQSIADHGDGGAYGVKDPSKLTDPKRLTGSEKIKVANAEADKPATNSAQKPPAQGNTPAGGPRGWANPVVQQAAQEARRAKLGTSP